MPRPFDITTPKDKVDLARDGKGQATFNVSNSSGATARGRARVVPGDPVQERWYKIDGDQERTLRHEQTTQYIVRAEVPKNAAKGEYTLRLDMIALDRTDEVAVEGPRVVVPWGGPVITDVKKKFPWLIVAIAAIVLLAGGGVLAWLLTRGPAEVEVPKVVGLTFDAATTELKKVDLTAQRGDAEKKNDVAPDTVLRQDPEAGKRAAEGDVVKLTVATRDTVRVPRVVDKIVSAALADVTGAGLNPKVETVLRAGSPEGIVVDQTPKPEEEAARGAEVTLSVTAAAAVVPKVKDQVLSDAVAIQFSKANLFVAPESVFNAKAPHNTILNVTPDGGSTVAARSVVRLVVTRRGNDARAAQAHSAEVRALLTRHGLLKTHRKDQLMIREAGRLRLPSGLVQPSK